MTRARIRQGESVLIHGIGGGVATAALGIAKVAGAAPVFVTSSSEEKLQRARELGADHCLNYDQAEVGRQVRSLTAGRGLDVVVDCVGAATWLQSLEMASRVLCWG